MRECLKLDPEHKDCYPFYKKIKKVPPPTSNLPASYLLPFQVAKFLTSSKEARDREDWEECVSSAQKVLKNEPHMDQVQFHAYDKLCQCQKMTGELHTCASLLCFII